MNNQTNEAKVWFGILDTGAVIDVSEMREHAESILEGLKPHGYQDATIIELVEVKPNTITITESEYAKLKAEISLLNDAIIEDEILVAYTKQLEQTIDEQKALIDELADLLSEARDDVSECLGNDMPNEGWERFDRRIKYRQNHLAKIDEALAKVKAIALPSEKG